MKKLFFLGFLLLLSMLAFSATAIAESNGEATETLEEPLDTISPYAIDVYQANSDSDEETPEAQRSLENISEGELITLNCKTFVIARNVSDLTKEPLHQKQSLFIGNLEFAKHSQFRLDPKDTSLEEINSSFLQSDFVKERLDSLKEMEEEYKQLLSECLTKQKETVSEKQINDLKEKRTIAIQEEKKRLEKTASQSEENIRNAQKKAKRDAAKQLQQAKKAAEAKKKYLKARVNEAYGEVYSGSEASIYNKTIVSSENELEQLPSKLKKEEIAISRNKEQAIKKSEKRAVLSKKKLIKKHKEKIKKIREDFSEKIKAVKQEKKESLQAITKESGETATRVYEERKTTVAQEGESLEERKKYGSDLITYLKYLWQEDKQKKLLRVDTESINLDSTTITIKGVLDPLKAKNKQTLQKARKKGKQKAKKESKKIRSEKSGKVAGKNLNTSKKEGKTRKSKKPQGKPDLVARVSWFNDSVTASGVSASNRPGVALNLKPGTHAGWNNKKTDKWMLAARKGNPYYARIQIKGKTITVPIIDKGPHERTGRGIDITLVAAQKMGWSASNFPTDSIGKMWIVGQKKR
jgi:hypothetical protein